MGQYIGKMNFSSKDIKDFFCDLHKQGDLTLVFACLFLFIILIFSWSGLWFLILPVSVVLIIVMKLCFDHDDNKKLNKTLNEFETIIITASNIRVKLKTGPNSKPKKKLLDKIIKLTDNYYELDEAKISPESSSVEVVENE